MKRGFVFALLLILCSSIAFAALCGNHSYCTNNVSDSFCVDSATIRSISCFNVTHRIIERQEWFAPCCLEDLRTYGGNLSEVMTGCAWNGTWVFDKFSACSGNSSCFDGECFNCSSIFDNVCEPNCLYADPDCADFDKDSYNVLVDCDDNNNKIFPYAFELCDGLDNNCDGVVPTSEVDKDGDGFLACVDCDDLNANIFPTSSDCGCGFEMANEICDNNIDDDCDGDIDKKDSDCTGVAKEGKPIANFTINSSNRLVNKSIAFFDYSGSFDGITRYNWDFGDGSSSSNANTSHIYTEQGDYLVILSVTDTNGSTDPYVRKIAIRNCFSDFDCSGSVCLSPGTLNSSCSVASCNPACESNSDCDDGNNETRDKCLNLGTCSARCSNKLSSLELNLISPSGMNYNTDMVLVNYTTNRPASCSYILNNGNRVRLFTGNAFIKVKDGNNDLRVECSDGQNLAFVETSFEADFPKEIKEFFLVRWWKAIVLWFKQVRIDMPTRDEKSSLLRRVFGSDDKISKTEETEKHLDIDKSALNEEDGSTVNIKINPDKVMYNVTIIEEIPKDLAFNVSEIEFENDNYEVIEDDPVLMWHFEELREDVEINYKVKGEVNEEDSPSTLAVAEEVSDEDAGNAITGAAIAGDEEDINVTKIIVPLLLIPAVGLVLIIFNRFGKNLEHKDKKKKRVKKSNEALSRYVVNQVVLGAEKDEIKDNLLKKGWGEHEINKVFDDLEREI